MLTLENIEYATLAPGIDPLDTLQRIATAWLAIGLTCDCGPPPDACDICWMRFWLSKNETRGGVAPQPGSRLSGDTLPGFLHTLEIEPCDTQ